MALHDCKLLHPRIAYAIWFIEETQDQLSTYAQQAEISLSLLPSHPKKRQEHLAARLSCQAATRLLHLPIQPVLKNKWGAPYRADGQAYMSLSHAFPFAIALVAKDTPVGVDLQLPSPKLQRVQTKYLCPPERAAVEQAPEKALVYWCAKEAIYKAANLPGLSLQAIEIGPLPNRPSSTVYGCAQHVRYVVHYQVKEAYTVAWAHPADYNSKQD